MTSCAPAVPWCPPACVCRSRICLPANIDWNSARWIPPAASPPARRISKSCSVVLLCTIFVGQVVNPPALKPPLRCSENRLAPFAACRVVGQPIPGCSRLSVGSFGPGATRAPLPAQVARRHKEILGREAAILCHAKAILDLADALRVPVGTDGEFRAGGFGAANEGRTVQIDARHVVRGGETDRRECKRGDVLEHKTMQSAMHSQPP